MSLIGNPKKPVAGEAGRQKKADLVVGARVRTNARYKREISPVPREGVVVRRHAPISGCWVVQMNGFTNDMHIHEYYLEVLQ